MTELQERNVPPNEAECATGGAPSDATRLNVTPFRGLSLTGNFIWTLIGNVIGMGCQWLLVVLLAKVAHADVVGEFALAVAIAGPITFLADLRLRVLYVVDLQDRYPFAEVLGARYALSCISIAIIVITCAIAHYGTSTALVVVVIGISQLIDIISDSFYANLQKGERMDHIATSVIARNVLAAIAFIGAVSLSGSLLWGAFGMVFGRVVVLLAYDTRAGVDLGATGFTRAMARAIMDRLKPAWNRARQLRMIWAAVPLAVTSLLVSLNGYLPRYVLESIVGRHDLGIFSAINYVTSGCFMVTTALGYAVFPRLSKLFSTGGLAQFTALLGRVTAAYAALGVCGVGLSAIFGRQLLTIVYKPEYAEHVDLLRWLMIVGAVQCLTTAMQCGLTAASRFAVQVPVFATVTITSFVGCMLLVPRMGLNGAAIAVLISSLVQLFANTGLLLWTMVVRANELKNAPAPEAALVTGN